MASRFRSIRSTKCDPNLSARSQELFLDKLVKVVLRNGEKRRVFIHVEVQGDPERALSRRMFRYNYRIRDRYDDDNVVGLAVLTDANRRYRPGPYEFSMWGCGVTFTYPYVKLVDWAGKWEELEGSANPFGVIVAAQLRSVLAKDDEERLGWKVGLIRGLYERGYSKERILELYRFVDWLITLPEGLAERFHAEVTQIEEEKKMPYVTTAERIGIKKGIRQGMEKGMERGTREGLMEGILLALELRFGREGSRLEGQLGRIRNIEELRSIKDLAKTAPDLETLKREIIKLSPKV